jgi:glyoxylase-like metal-dependent hydrolase (beta-lactamase superfamily II)
VNVLLVHIGRRVVLLDAGLGPKAHGTLMASLGETKVSPKAVTDILITHTHGDHIGGLLDENGHLAFPKATIRMASAEWAWLQKTGPQEVVKAISDHVRTFEPGAQVAPGITAVALGGHTPGHVGYEIVSGDSRLLDVGDMVHSSIVSLQKPQWTLQFDSDSPLAKNTRHDTLARLAQDQELVYAPHFPFPGVGHIVANGDAFAWKGEVP